VMFVTRLLVELQRHACQNRLPATIVQETEAMSTAIFAMIENASSALVIMKDNVQLAAVLTQRFQL
jgi:hypothetical protein